MNLADMFIFLVIFGLVGFVISKIWGINFYRIFSDVSAAIIIVMMLIIMLPAVFNPENALDTIPDFIGYFVSVLPGIIIGDIAGSVVGEITN